MWQGFIGQRVTAGTRKLRTLGIALLLVALVLGLCFAKTLVNVAQGPASVDDKWLAAVTNPYILWRNFVTVKGRKTISTGMSSIEQTTQNGAVISEQTTGEFMIMAVGEHLLVVKARTKETAESYTGGVVALSDYLKTQILSQLSDRDLKEATLSVMLDATGSYSEGLVAAYVLVGILVLAGVCVLALAKRRTENPERHPLCNALSAYGPLYTIVPQIDGEVSSYAWSSCGVTFTPSWILKGSKVMRRDELVWVYKKLTKTSVHFIPAGTSHAVILRDSRGKLIEINGREQVVNVCMANLVEVTPWVALGYSQELQGTYNRERNAFVQGVSERRATMQRRKA